MKEDKESWLSFLRHLKERGLKGTVGGDKCIGLIEALIETYPLARLVHFCRNIFSAVPRGKVKQVLAMLRAIHAQEDKGATLDKLEVVVNKLKEMKLFEVGKKVADTGFENLVYMDFPMELWRRIRSDNAMERLTERLGQNQDGWRIRRWPVCFDVNVCPSQASGPI